VRRLKRSGDLADDVWMIPGHVALFGPVLGQVVVLDRRLAGEALGGGSVAVGVMGRWCMGSRL